MPNEGISGFGRCQELRNLGFHVPKIGFKNAKAGSIVNTLNARVKVAKAFQGIQLPGFKDDTVAGYSALFQVFLTYSAFEQFLELHSLKYPSDVDHLLPRYEPERIADQIRDCDPGFRFIRFLEGHLENKRLLDYLGKFQRGVGDNVIELAAATRHIFAHGYLSAYAQGARPKIVCAICNPLSDFTLSFMDSEFSQTIESFYEREAMQEKMEQREDTAG